MFRLTLLFAAGLTISGSSLAFFEELQDKIEHSILKGLKKFEQLGEVLISEYEMKLTKNPEKHHSISKELDAKWIELKVTLEKQIENLRKKKQWSNNFKSKLTQHLNEISEKISHAIEELKKRVLPKKEHTTPTDHEAPMEAPTESPTETAEPASQEPTAEHPEL